MPMNRISQPSGRCHCVARNGLCQNPEPACASVNPRRNVRALTCLMVAFALVFHFGETLALAQPKAANKKEKPGTKKLAPKAAQPVDDMKIDSESLPPGYRPP